MQIVTLKRIRNKETGNNVSQGPEMQKKTPNVYNVT